MFPSLPRTGTLSPRPFWARNAWLRSSHQHATQLAAAPACSAEAPRCLFRHGAPDRLYRKASMWSRTSECTFFQTANRKSQHRPSTSLPQHSSSEATAAQSATEAAQAAASKEAALAAAAELDVFNDGEDSDSDEDDLDDEANEDVLLEALGGSRAEVQPSYQADAERFVQTEAIDEDELIPVSKDEARLQVEHLILNGGNDMSMAQLTAAFPFPLDSFQQASVQHFLAGKSVVVCAPTGAGKTAIAEAAAVAVLAKGQRVIYTTPLKALSNQKLSEMRLRFGDSRVGLQTGDGTLNPDSDIVVMTTEILRNIMYRQEDDAANSRREDRLASVGLIVLDEVHYMGDPGRGSVWEETIINCPKHIQMLAMSATISNAEDLGGWIGQVHGECETVTTKWRPVPLTWHFCYSNGRETKLVRLLARSGRSLHSALLPPSDPSSQWHTRHPIENTSRMNRRELRNRRFRGESEAVLSGAADRPPAVGPDSRAEPDHAQVVAVLAAAELLPAIWFIFSRRGCEDAVKGLYSSGVQLTTQEERAVIEAEVRALRAEQPEAVPENLVKPLLCGLASHHAGCLPAWKSLIERCFQRGLLKVVVATETLAAGINMPARTTIISSLSHRQATGHALLKHNQLLQMAGRAGRRGFDIAGHCVVLHNRFEGADSAASIITNDPEPLLSQFAAGYSMVLNLLHTRSLEDAKAFLDRSFGNYMGGGGHSRRMQLIKVLEVNAAAYEKELGELDEQLDGTEDVAAVYVKLQSRLKQERAAVLTLRIAAVQERCDRAEAALPASALPQPVGVDLAVSEDLAGAVLPAMALRRLEPSEHDHPAAPPYFLCLSAANTFLMISSRQIVGVGLCPPSDEILQPGQSISSGSGNGAPSSFETYSVTDTSAVLPADSGSSLDTWGDCTGRVANPFSSPQAAQPPLSPSTIGSSNSSSSSNGSGPPMAAAAVDSASDGTDGSVGSGEYSEWRHEGEDGRYDEDGTEWSLSAAEVEILCQLSGDGSKCQWGSWASLPIGVQSAAGPRESAHLAARLPPAAAIEPLEMDPSLEEALLEQRAVARQVKGQLKKVKGKGVAKETNKRRRRVVAKLAAQRDRIAEARATLDEALSSGWRTFESLRDVLVTAGALEEGTLKALPLGNVARQLNGTNELWLAIALGSPAVADLQPPQLAAICAALVSNDAVSRPQMRCAYEASLPVLEAVAAVVHDQQGLALLQEDIGVDVPLDIDLRLAGLVEAWAEGAGWEALTADCSLDGGDIARLLSRTTDLLRQAAHIPQLQPSLRTAARKASRAMDRAPISELLR